MPQYTAHTPICSANTNAKAEKGTTTPAPVWESHITSRACAQILIRRETRQQERAWPLMSQQHSNNARARHENTTCCTTSDLQSTTTGEGDERKRVERGRKREREREWKEEGGERRRGEEDEKKRRGEGNERKDQRTVSTPPHTGLPLVSPSFLALLQG